MEQMECQYHNNCGGYCETEEERDQCLCCDRLEAERQQDADDAALVAVRAAVTRARRKSDGALCL
jgi:hypothetical protein